MVSSEPILEADLGNLEKRDVFVVDPEIQKNFLDKFEVGQKNISSLALALDLKANEEWVKKLSSANELFGFREGELKVLDPKKNDQSVALLHLVVANDNEIIKSVCGEADVMDKIPKNKAQAALLTFGLFILAEEKNKKDKEAVVRNEPGKAAVEVKEKESVAKIPEDILIAIRPIMEETEDGKRKPERILKEEENLRNEARKRLGDIYLKIREDIKKDLDYVSDNNEDHLSRQEIFEVVHERYIEDMEYACKLVFSKPEAAVNSGRVRGKKDALHWLGRLGVRAQDEKKAKSGVNEAKNGDIESNYSKLLLEIEGIMDQDKRASARKMLEIAMWLGKNEVERNKISNQELINKIKPIWTMLGIKVV